MRLLIESLNASNLNTIPITETEVMKYITTLKSNKAADAYGITSEHLKHASPLIVTAITALLKSIFEKRCIPDTLKLGILTPVAKKGKDATCPDSYRRITVTPVISKLIEMHILAHSRPILNRIQNRQQRGFSAQSSSVNAALLLTECIAEAKDAKSPVYIQYLDAKKAFDLVWHTGLLCALHEQGVTGPVWDMYNSMYTDISSCVKWGGQVSSIFHDRQGLRQGGYSSADIFKAKTNLMLNQQEHSVDLYCIGSVVVGAPTCADDTALISSTLTDANMVLSIAVKDSCNQRYIYSTTKSKVMIVNPTTVAKEQLKSFPLSLLENPLEESTQETHLGIQRICTAYMQCMP
jgi:hypothetical protein